MLSVAEYKREVAELVHPVLSYIRELSVLVVDYITPAIVLNRNEYRDMWMYINLRFTDYVAMEQTLSYFLDPKPAFHEPS